MKTQSFVSPLAFWAEAVSAAKVDTAIRAYHRGDYSEALDAFESLARQGNSRAQHFLGEMYSNGHGVPRDPEAALKWYLVAAEGGQLEAQAHLGYLYADGGDGVHRDRARGYAWLSMAAAKGDQRAAGHRDQTAKSMALHELEKAEALYREWLRDGTRPERRGA